MHSDAPLLLLFLPHGEGICDFHRVVWEAQKWAQFPPPPVCDAEADSQLMPLCQALSFYSLILVYHCSSFSGRHAAKQPPCSSLCCLNPDEVYSKSHAFMWVSACTGGSLLICRLLCCIPALLPPCFFHPCSQVWPEGSPSILTGVSKEVSVAMLLHTPSLTGLRCCTEPQTAFLLIFPVRVHHFIPGSHCKTMNSYTVKEEVMCFCIRCHFLLSKLDTP